MSKSVFDFVGFFAHRFSRLGLINKKNIYNFINKSDINAMPEDRLIFFYFKLKQTPFLK